MSDTTTTGTEEKKENMVENFEKGGSRQEEGGGGGDETDLDESRELQIVEDDEEEHKDHCYVTQKPGVEVEEEVEEPEGEDEYEEEEMEVEPVKTEQNDKEINQNEQKIEEQKPEIIEEIKPEIEETKPEVEEIKPVLEPITEETKPATEPKSQELVKKSPSPAPIVRSTSQEEEEFLDYEEDLLEDPLDEQKPTEQQKEPPTSTTNIGSNDNTITTKPTGTMSSGPSSSVTTTTGGASTGGASTLFAEDAKATSIWIRGMAPSTKASSVKQLTSQYGKVIQSKIFNSRPINGEIKNCFALVTFAEMQPMEQAITGLHKKNYQGRVLRVEKVSESQLTNPAERIAKEKREAEKKAAAAAAAVITIEDDDDEPKKELTPKKRAIIMPPENTPPRKQQQQQSTPKKEHPAIQAPKSAEKGEKGSSKRPQIQAPPRSSSREDRPASANIKRKPITFDSPDRQRKISDREDSRRTIAAAPTARSSRKVSPIRSTSGKGGSSQESLIISARVDTSSSNCRGGSVTIKRSVERAVPNNISTSQLRRNQAPPPPQPTSAPRRHVPPDSPPRVSYQTEKYSRDNDSQLRRRQSPPPPHSSSAGSRDRYYYEDPVVFEQQLHTSRRGAVEREDATDLDESRELQIVEDDEEKHEDQSYVARKPLSVPTTTGGTTESTSTREDEYEKEEMEVEPVKTEQNDKEINQNELKNRTLLLIRGLSPSTNVSNVERLATQYGKVIQSKIFKTLPINGEIKNCFALVTFAEMQSMDKAIEGLAKKKYYGRKLGVEMVTETQSTKSVVERNATETLKERLEAIRIQAAMDAERIMFEREKLERMRLELELERQKFALEKAQRAIVPATTSSGDRDRNRRGGGGSSSSRGDSRRRPADSTHSSETPAKLHTEERGGRDRPQHQRSEDRGGRYNSTTNNNSRSSNTSSSHHSTNNTNTTYGQQTNGLSRTTPRGGAASSATSSDYIYPGPPQHQQQYVTHHQQLYGHNTNGYEAHAMATGYQGYGGYLENNDFTWAGLDAQGQMVLDTSWAGAAPSSSTSSSNQYGAQPQQHHSTVKRMKHEEWLAEVSKRSDRDKFVCVVCATGTTTQPNMQIHMKMHTSVREEKKNLASESAVQNAFF